MIMRVHGFDWKVYCERVMRVFTAWLVEDAEQPLYQLYIRDEASAEGRSTQEEARRYQLWQQAHAFISYLPRGPHAVREYQTICAPEQFTVLSDRYIYRHPPQLYHNSEAVRALWNGLIEDHCLPWFQLTSEMSAHESMRKLVGSQSTRRTLRPIISVQRQNELLAELSSAEEPIFRDELVALLQCAGFTELAETIALWKITQPVSPVQHTPTSLHAPTTETVCIAPADEEMDEGNVQEEENEDVSGVIIGQNFLPLQLRGWLGTISLRAMGLFELLSCGRRCMPFGYEANDFTRSYIGYLTPDEVWQLALCLRATTPPTAEAVEQDLQYFRRQQREKTIFRLLDEVLPEYSKEFLDVVRIAALQGLGLICSVE